MSPAPIPLRNGQRLETPAARHDAREGGTAGDEFIEQLIPHLERATS